MLNDREKQQFYVMPDSQLTNSGTQYL